MDGKAISNPDFDCYDQFGNTCFDHRDFDSLDIGTFLIDACDGLVFYFWDGFTIYPAEESNLHKEWMIRSYVVTFAFVLFRWLTSQPFDYELGTFQETGPTAIWVSWVIPLFITEIILQWNKK